jgi:hypothetical protein
MSAMSSVPVAPNKLTHTGPLDDPQDRRPLAGIFKIRVPEWTDERIPHPLGRTVEGLNPGDEVWVTGTHMHFLDQWAAKGVLPVVDVTDSWTGRKNGSLFQEFCRWSRTVRQTTSGPERAEAKAAMSRAVRSLHPRKARSPFWRPDWHKAILAEAALRHWIRAYQAVSQGAVLLSIGAVDEVAFAVPAGQDPATWLPPAYVVGAEYGEVKHKELTYWTPNAENPKTPHKHEALSPVTIEQWQQRRRAVAVQAGTETARGE